MRNAVVVGMILALVAAANAGTWDEFIDGGGDAGQTGIGGAQLTTGSGQLTAITGSLSSSADADVYGIKIVDEANFLAEVWSASWDTQLFLFNDDGSGQVENDDYSGHGLQSAINSDGVFSNGIYYLGISSYNNDPVDAGGSTIFGYSTYPGTGDQRMPTSTNPYADFNGSGYSSGDYTINLTGAEFFRVPEPASLALLGLAGLVVLRRR